MRILRAAIPLATLAVTICLTTVPVLAQGDLPTPGVFRPQSAPPPQAKGAMNPAQQHLMKGMKARQAGRMNEAIAEFRAVIKLVPNSPVGYYQLANAYMAKGDMTSAKQQLQKVMQLDPKHAAQIKTQMFQMEVGSYMMKGDRKSAETVLRKALDSDPSNMSIRMQLMQLNIQSTPPHPAEAIAFGLPIAKANPKDPNIHFMLGVAYLLQKDSSSAIDQFKTVTQLSPKNVGAYFNLGLLYKEKQQWGAARQALSKAMALNPKDPRTIGLLADVELNADKTNGPKRALEVYKKALAANPNDPQLQFSLGIMYEKTNNTKLALQQYEKVAAKVPGFALAKVNAARILLMDKTAKDPKANMQKAKGYLAAVAKQAPNSAQILAMLGYAEVSLGETANAEAHYKKALSLASDKEKPGILDGLSYIYQTTNRPKDAQAMVEKLHALQPDNVKVALRLAGMYEGETDPKKALALYQQIVEKFPKDTEAMSARASYLQRQKMIDKAAEQYRAVLKIKPDDLDTQIKLAGLYQTSEDKVTRDKAIPELEAAKKMALKEKAPTKDNEYDRRIEPFSALAQLYDKDGEKAKAADQYNQFLQSVPKSAQAHQGLAQLYANDPATYDKAIDEYKQLIALQPDNPGYYSQFAEAVKKKTGKEDDEYSELKKLIDASPTNNTPRYVLASMIVSRDAAPLDEAMKQYDEILKAKPNDGQALAGVAGVYEKQKKTDEAIEQYKKAILADPQQSRFLTKMQPLIAAKNDPKVTADWITFLKSLIGKKDMSSPAFYTMYMDECTKANRGDEAVATLEEANKKDPKDMQALLTIGAYYEKQGQHDKALATYKRVLNTKDVYENYKGDAYKGMGDVYFSQRKWNDALTAYQNWKSRQMFFFRVEQAQIRIAQCYEYLGKTDKALAEYKNLANGDPGNQELQAAIKRLNPEPTKIENLMTPAPAPAPAPAMPRPASP